MIDRTHLLLSCSAIVPWLKQLVCFHHRHLKYQVYHLEINPASSFHPPKQLNQSCLAIMHKNLFQTSAIVRLADRLLFRGTPNLEVPSTDEGSWGGYSWGLRSFMKMTTYPAIIQCGAGGRTRKRSADEVHRWSAAWDKWKLRVWVCSAEVLCMYWTETRFSTSHVSVRHLLSEAQCVNEF